MRFLVDTQLPLALADWFRQQGHEAEHVREVGLDQGKDNPIWLYAIDKGAAIVTKDDDFAEWVQRGRAGPAVVWLRIGNSSNRALVTWLSPLLPRIVSDLGRGERLVEVR